MTHNTIQQHALWRNKHTNRTTMRKLLLVAAFFSITLTTYAQMIASQNGNQICSGFEMSNCAHIAVVAPPPVPLAANSIMLYTWTAEHANGTWIWHSNHPTRTVPLPFVGQYMIQVKIEYMRKGTKRPYAAFWSNKVYIHGMDCQ